MSPTGHLAIGFAAKRWDSKIPLIWYLAGAYVIDIVYFVLLALGIESSSNDPWSHSLLMAIVWSILFALIVWVIVKHRRSALLMGLVVFSHWVLDFIVWDNLQLGFSKTPMFGLGLYRIIGFNISALKLDMGSLVATSIELGLLIIGIILYWTAKKKPRSASVSTFD
jgi:hypothetical protein